MDPNQPLDQPIPRSILWLKGRVDPAAPPMAPNAPFLGLDKATRDVFIHAPSLNLDLLEVARAHGTGPGHCIFANPSAVGTTDEAFVTVNYIERHHPALFADLDLAGLRQRVRAAYMRDRRAQDE